MSFNRFCFTNVHNMSDFKILNSVKHRRKLSFEICFLSGQKAQYNPVFKLYFQLTKL